jgi:hypothetical protein
MFSGGFHRDRYRKSERRTRQFGFTDFTGIDFADFTEVVRGFFLASLLCVSFFNCLNKFNLPKKHLPPQLSSFMLCVGKNPAPPAIG